MFWNYHEDRTNLCGCGELLWSCPVWRPVIAKTIECMREEELEDTISLHDKLRIGRRWWHQRDRTRYEKYLGRLEVLYRAMAEQTGSRVIVDSSKSSSYALTLNDVPGFEVYLIDLTRDPRGSAYSNLQKKAYLPTYSVWSSSWGFNRAHIAPAINFRHMRNRMLPVRYEELVSHPQGEIQRIMDFCGEPVENLSFIEGHTIDFRDNHTMAGNPDRLVTGRTELKLDERWREGLSPGQRWAVNVLTWPLLKKFRYM